MDEITARAIGISSPWAVDIFVIDFLAFLEREGLLDEEPVEVEFAPTADVVIM